MFRVTATAVAQHFATASLLWPARPSLAPCAGPHCAALESAALVVQTRCVSRWRATTHKRLCRPAPRSRLQDATRLKSAALRTVHRPATGWPMHRRRAAHAAAAQPDRRSAKSRERHPKRCHRGAETPLNDAENGVHVCTSWALRRRRRETLDGFLPWGGPQSVRKRMLNVESDEADEQSTG